MAQLSPIIMVAIVTGFRTGLFSFLYMFLSGGILFAWIEKGQELKLYKKENDANKDCLKKRVVQWIELYEQIEVCILKDNLLRD